MREPNESLSASEWAAARGEKWRTQLTGMEAMLRPVDEPLLRALQLDLPSRIVDVGCGGGGTALEILRRAPAGSVVHGFDVSPSLIELARGRPQLAERAVVFELADMATATTETPYDRLVSRFGTMFFDDPRAAFANLMRWLVPAGRFAFAVWGPLSDNPWMSSVRDVVARVVELPRTAPGAPGPFRYAASGDLLAVLDQAGLTDLSAHDWQGALPIGGGLPPAEAARFALSSFASFAEQLDLAGDDALEEARRSLTTCFADHQHEGVVRLGARVHIVTGARPR